MCPFEPVNGSGATPITVKGTLFRKMVLPTTSLSEAKSVRHNSWPRTTTASRPGTLSSSGRNARPNASGTSSTRKKSPLTNSPNFICGSAPFSVANPNCEYCLGSHQARIGFIPVTEVLEIRIGQPGVLEDPTDGLAPQLRLNHDELGSMWHGQRPQQKRVRQAEHGRVGANSQSQRNDGYQSESRALPQGAQSVPKVIEHALSIARFLPHRRTAYLLANAARDKEAPAGCRPYLGLNASLADACVGVGLGPSATGGLVRHRPGLAVGPRAKLPTLATLPHCYSGSTVRCSWHGCRRPSGRACPAGASFARRRAGPGGTRADQGVCPGVCPTKKGESRSTRAEDRTGS